MTTETGQSVPALCMHTRPHSAGSRRVRTYNRFKGHREDDGDIAWKLHCSPSGLPEGLCLQHPAVRGALQVPAPQGLLDDWVALCDAGRAPVGPLSSSACASPWKLTLAGDPSRLAPAQQPDVSLQLPGQ